MEKNKKVDYVGWGLDDGTPAIMDASLDVRKKILNKITRRLDAIILLLVCIFGALVFDVLTAWMAFFI
jgi:hypothetical protein